MTEIKYVCSNRKEYNLVSGKMRVTSGNFHKYNWKKKATEMKIGDSVYGFTKEAATYSLTFTFRGSLEDRKRALDELTNAFEYDVANTSPGRFYFGDYYIEGYVVEAITQVSDIWTNWTNNTIEIYCPYPFWSKEQKKSFYPDASGERNEDEYEYLDFEYDYPYDYTKQASGSQHWKVEHYTSSNFKMIIYGRCVNPRIVINGHVYQVYDTLEDNEYMVIYSRDKTVTKHLANGTIQNIFERREKEQSVFELIPADDLLVSWSGEFGFDITLYLERSEPLWN